MSLVNSDLAALGGILGPLAGERAYLVYRLVASAQGGRPDKIPCNPATGGTEAPNDANSRGVLTFYEAATAAEKLGEGFGVGVFPARIPTFVAVDLDSCYDAATTTMDPWAAAIVGSDDVYAELSPSLTGLRILLIDRKGHLERIATGTERCGIGLYGAPTCKKFVTLTGLALPEARLQIIPSERASSKILAHLASMMGQARVRRFGGLDYPPGPPGLEEAISDILSGASLHPATLRVASAWHADSHKSTQQIEEDLLDLYDRSEAKTKTPRRWAIRREKSIRGVVEWLGKRPGAGSVRMADLPTQHREAARALVLRHRPQEPLQEAEEAPAAPVEAAPKLWGPQAAPEPGVSALVAPRAAQNEIDENLEAFKERLLLDVEEDLARVEDEGELEWMLDPPSAGLKHLIDHMHASMAAPAPPVVALAALVGLSIAGQHRFIAEGSRRTALNLQALIVASTGTGKEALRQILADIARMSRVMVAERPASAPGLHQAFMNAKDQSGSPNLFLSMDEVAVFLRSASAGRDGNLHDQLRFGIMSAATLPMGVLEATTYSQTAVKKPAIPTPYLVAAGFTTPSEFQAAVGDRLLRDGWANRQIVALPRGVTRQPLGWKFPPEGELPEAVRDMIEHIRLGAYLDVIRPGDPQLQFLTSVRERRMRVLPLAAMADVELDQELRELQDRWVDTDPRREVLSRYKELVIKVAGLLALGDVGGLGMPWETAAIGSAHIAWARRFVRFSAEAFIGSMDEGGGGGALHDPVARLTARLRQWRDHPYSHPDEARTKISRSFAVGLYPEWALRIVVGRGRSPRELEDICKSAGLRRLGPMRRNKGRPGIMWGYEPMGIDFDEEETNDV